MQILANCICVPSLGTLPYSVVELHWTYYLSHQLQEKWQEDKEQQWGVVAYVNDFLWICHSVIPAAYTNVDVLCVFPRNDWELFDSR